MNHAPQERSKFAARIVSFRAAERPAPEGSAMPAAAVTPQAMISASADVSLDFPAAAMYGRLRELAQKMEMPLGLGYPALLGCFSYIPMPDELCGTRINLFVGLIAPVGGGKNTAITRACRLLDLKKKVDWRVTTASSDRGLMGIIGDHQEGKGSNKRTVAGPTKMLLRTNEMRGTLKKAAIEGSVLADMLCEVWDSGQWECSDKTGSQACDCRLSWIGGIPVKDDSPEEFADAFGRETSNGLMSRMLLGYAASEKFDGSKPWSHEVPIGIQSTCYDPGLMDDLVSPMVPTERYQKVESLDPAAQRLYTAWVNLVDIDGRLKYNLMKIALLTASANLDSEVSVGCMEAAIAFIEWQCRLRGVFKPSEAKDTPEAVLGEIIMDKLHKLAALGQEPIRWRRVCKGKDAREGIHQTQLSSLGDQLHLAPVGTDAPARHQGSIRRTLVVGSQTRPKEQKQHPLGVVRTL
jgi:hypothetical protein